MIWSGGDQVQVAAGEFLLEFAVGLVNQFDKVQTADLQLQIPGAGFGSLHQILRQIFQTVGFLLQHVQITQDFFILDIFPFD